MRQTWIFIAFIAFTVFVSIQGDECQTCIAFVRGLKGCPVESDLTIEQKVAICFRRTCSILTVPFIGCQDESTSQNLTAAFIKSLHEDGIITCQLAGLCGNEVRSPRPLQTCGGPCSSQPQCGPGCYCGGMGECTDNCNAACQGESQWCPQGCQCGDYGFCDVYV